MTVVYLSDFCDPDASASCQAGMAVHGLMTALQDVTSAAANTRVRGFICEEVGELEFIHQALGGLIAALREPELVS